MKTARAAIITSPDCYGLTAATIAIDEFGTESLNWLPSNLEDSLKERFGDIPYTVINKLNAAVLVLTSDEYRHRLDRFVLVCNAISSGIIEDTVSTLPNVFWGLVEIELLDPSKEQERQPPYTADIIKYVEILHTFDGLALSPPLLKQTGIYINKMADVLSEFSDDPQMHDAFVDVLKSRIAVYEYALAHKLKELGDQLVKCGFANATKLIATTLNVKYPLFEESEK